jgi:FkbM family methyltransferase
MMFFIKRYFYIFFYKVFNFVAPQEGENIILERIFGKKTRGFYVDVGAHHPVHFSNTLNLYQKGWSGINIEPNDEEFKAFKKMRPRDINLNIAISTNKNSCVYYKFKDPALNTTDINILKMRERQGYKCIKKIHVQTQTLNQVLSKYCKINSAIDILKIDVEGKELDVLKSNNWKKFIPNIIICEIINVDVVKMLNNSVYKFLKSKNYILYCKLLQNVFFFHKSFQKKFLN